MKELEQELRKSALWRVWGFWVFIIALCITYLLAMHNLYASAGEDELVQTKQKIEEESKGWQEEKEKLQKQKTQLAKELEACKKDNDPEEKLAECEDLILAEDDKIADLDRKLMHCKGDLRAAQMNN